MLRIRVLKVGPAGGGVPQRFISTVGNTFSSTGCFGSMARGRQGRAGCDASGTGAGWGQEEANRLWGKERRSELGQYFHAFFPATHRLAPGWFKIILFFLGMSFSKWPGFCVAASVCSLIERLRFFREGLGKGFKN